MKAYYWFNPEGVEIDGIHVEADEFDCLDLLATQDQTSRELALSLEGRPSYALKRLEKKGMVTRDGSNPPVWALTERGAIPFGGLA